MFVTMMMVFNVCVNDSAASLFKHSVFVEKLLVMSFDWSCDSYHCCDDWWLSVAYYNGTQQKSTLQCIGKLSLYQIMKQAT